MKSKNLLQLLQQTFRSRLGRVLLFSILGASTALACAWNMLTEHSVRFNSMRTGRGFYRLPPLPVEYHPATGKERSTIEIEQDIDTENPEFENENENEDEKADDGSQTWDAVVAAIEESKLSDVDGQLKKYLELTQYNEYWESYDDSREHRQKRRNISFDLLDAMSALRQGSKANSVSEYLKARLAFNLDPEAADSHIGSAKPDRNLSDNWEYLRAAVLYNSGKKEEALAAFQTHLTRFPQSEKNEAVLYMIAKGVLEQSHSFTEPNCGIQGKSWRGDEDIDPAKIEDSAKCRDAQWQEAMWKFSQMLRKYPNGRYSNDVRGWLAFLHKRGGERAEALAEYYRLLGNTISRQWRFEAKKSLQIIGHEYDDETLDRVEEMIADEPDAALAYAYHRIYNHAIDLSYEKLETWLCQPGEYYKWSECEEETKRVKLALDNGKHELERVARFATAMVKQYGGSRVSGDFVLRIAEAQLELQNFKESLAFADRALAMGVNGDARTQALWVKGSSEHQQKKLAAAKATFTRLVGEFPDHKLTEGARRLLAMTAEDQDDLETALDLYFELKYETDVAYFVDVLMPTDRLARYVDKRADSPHYNTLLYSLGVRYMRDKRWDEAKAALRRVQTEKGRDDYLTSDRDKSWFFPKEPGQPYWEPKVTYIKTSWVMQDLKTIDILEHYEQAVESAQGDEAKAEAMYQLASAFFEADDLAFYSPAMWDGGRSGSLSELQFSDHERLPNESRIIFEHLQAHDPLAQAIPIYLEIATRFPQTNTARDALYSAAVAHERLSGRHSAWTSIYERGLFAGTRMVTYSDVKGTHPDYQLPRGTYGWKPSTRTVNGGPGWAAPPKPLPKVSRVDRAKKKLESWYSEYEPMIENGGAMVKGKVSEVSSGAADHLTNYLYLVYMSFIGLIVWTNRRQLYKGPIKKGFVIGRAGFVYTRNRWSANVSGWFSSRLSLLRLGKKDDKADGPDRDGD